MVVKVMLASMAKHGGRRGARGARVPCGVLGRNVALLDHDYDFDDCVIT
jgi:hypothetical protein